MIDSEPRENFEVHAVSTRASASTRAGVASWLLASCAFLLRYHGSTVLVLAVADAGLICLGLAVRRRGASRAGFALQNGRLFFSGYFSRREIPNQARDGAVVEMTIAFSKSSRGLPTWSIVNADGRCEAAIIAVRFDPAELERLRSRLGLRLERHDGAFSVGEASEMYPGLVPWWGRHIGVTAGVVAVMLAVVISLVS